MHYVYRVIIDSSHLTRPEITDLAHYVTLKQAKQTTINLVKIHLDSHHGRGIINASLHSVSCSGEVSKALFTF